jgi:hypothetical protein
MGQASLNKKQDPISRTTRVKTTDGMADAVECLSGECDAFT